MSAFHDRQAAALARWDASVGVLFRQLDADLEACEERALLSINPDFALWIDPGGEA